MSLQTAFKLIPTPKALLIKISVLNPCNRYEMFQRMSCSWSDNWRVDKAGIGFGGHDCLKNALVTLILPPRSAHHEETMRLFFSHKYKPGRVTFRIGLEREGTDFTSEELEQVYHSGKSYDLRTDPVRHRYTGRKEVIWSPPAATLVRREWLHR